MDSKELIELIKAAECKPYAYSGRGMFGRQCIAFNTDMSSIVALATIVQVACDVYDDVGDIREAAEAIENAQSDGMGMNSVIYFPAYEWIEDHEEEG